MSVHTSLGLKAAVATGAMLAAGQSIIFSDDQNNKKRYYIAMKEEYFLRRLEQPLRPLNLVKLSRHVRIVRIILFTHRYLLWDF